MPQELPTSVEAPAFRDVAVLGAGNGGKATAADLALQGLKVRLFEWQEYRANIEALLEEPVIQAQGAVAGEARLELVTTDLAEAIDQADLIIACVQGVAHPRLANELAPLLWDGAIVMLNPGSCGGALEFRRVLGEHQLDKYIILCETGTLTYGCRAGGPRGVEVYLRVEHVAFAALPGAATESLLAVLQPLFPGLRAGRDVLEVALCDGNPVIHPAIMLSNLAVVERLGEQHRFYSEGVTPAVARIIEAVDKERIAVGKALGYELVPEPEMCAMQGYASPPGPLSPRLQAVARERGRTTDGGSDYYECYAKSDVFGPIASPPSVEHRYLHEDVGLGLVTLVSLGEMLEVETPVARSLVGLATVVTGRDYLGEGRRTVEKLGLAGLSDEEREMFLQEARRVM